MDSSEEVSTPQAHTGPPHPTCKAPFFLCPGCAMWRQSRRKITVSTERLLSFITQGKCVSERWGESIHTVYGRGQPAGGAVIPRVRGLKFLNLTFQISCFLSPPPLSRKRCYNNFWELTNAPFCELLRAGLALNSSCYVQWGLRQWKGIVFRGSEKPRLSLYIQNNLNSTGLNRFQKWVHLKSLLWINEHLKHTWAPRQGKIISRFMENINRLWTAETQV